MRLIKQKLIGGMHRCKLCDSRVLLQGYDKNNRLTHIMWKKKICYECAFWSDILNHPPKYIEVIGNTCYKMYPMVYEKDNSMILGGNGKTRFFMRTDRTVFQSNDIWKVGTIPERFVKKFPVTAIEITKLAYNKLRTNNRKCKAMACFDRYHCWRYDLDLEKEDGPFNQIPINWKIGGEHCKSFIGFENILDRNN